MNLRVNSLKGTVQIWHCGIRRRLFEVGGAIENALV
jgi:hypothetical protein